MLNERKNVNKKCQDGTRSQIPEGDAGADNERREHKGAAVEPLPRVPGEARGGGRGVPRGAAGQEAAPAAAAGRRRRAAVPGRARRGAARQVRRPVAVRAARPRRPARAHLVQRRLPRECCAQLALVSLSRNPLPVITISHTIIFTYFFI